MRLFKYWKTDIIGLIILLCIGLFLWLGNRSIDNNGVDSLDHYRVSKQNSIILPKIRMDLEHMDRIINAQSDYLSILTFDDNIIDYKYEYETIWYNGDPLITGVKSFHFEYRDIYGNLLTHFNQDYKSITTIGYLIRKNDKRKDRRKDIIYKNMINVTNKMLSYSMN